MNRYEKALAVGLWLKHWIIGLPPSRTALVLAADAIDALLRKQISSHIVKSFPKPRHE